MTAVSSQDRLHVGTSDDGDFTLSWNGDEADELTLSVSEDPNDPDRAPVRLESVTGGATTIAGLSPDRRWYFTITSPAGQTVTASTRQVSLRGANNVRDIGGYPTGDGRSVRWGKVFRADSLSSLTDDDVNYLHASRIRTVVDFRGPQEVEGAGPDRVSAGTTHIHTPLLDDSTSAFAAVMTRALAEGDGDSMAEMLGGGKAEEISEHGFVRQLGRPATMAGYADTLRRIAEAPDEPLLYHCAGGKDRTGMMTALLMGILGVPDREIIYDFTLSNHFNERINKQRFDSLASRGVDIELVRPLMEQRPSQIEAMLATIRAEHSDWDDFARDCLKLSATEIGSIRKALISD